MVISLQKGGNVSLSQEEPGLRRVIIGLGWDMGAAEGPVFDLDGSAFMLGPNGKVRGDGDFVFYNNLRSEDGSVEHSGDNLTGVGSADDERLEIDLSHVPPDVERIAVAATIHEADSRRQTFGTVGHAFIRCLNADTEREIARYDLSADCPGETSAVFGELYRSNGDWQFRAVGQGYRGGLGPLARAYGVNA
jgi:tellurium resistance protein TerD